MELTLPYFAQSNLYYSAIALTNDYASIEISNLLYYLSEIIEKNQEKPGTQEELFALYIDRLKKV